MGTRAAVAGVLALSALTLVCGGGATPTARALPRLGLVSFDLRTHKERVFPPGDLAALSRSPDASQRLGTRTTRSTCSVCAVSTAHMTRSSSGARSRLAFAITNRFGQAKVFIYDPGRPKALRAVTRGQYGPVPSIAWSPDGRRLLFVRTRG